MAGRVEVAGHFEPGEKVEVFPTVDALGPAGTPIKTVTVGKDGVVTVEGLTAGDFFLRGSRTVKVHVPEAVAVQPEPQRLSEEEIRERLAGTRPDAIEDAEDRVVRGARTTASRPRRATGRAASPRRTATRRAARGAAARAPSRAVAKK